MTDQNKRTDPDQDWIAGILDDLSTTGATPGDALMARVLGDAASITAARQAQADTVTKLSFWEQLSRVLGGWPAMGGLAAAGVAGLWIGIAPPSGIATFTATVLGSTEEISLFGTDLETLLGEAVDG